MKKLITLNTSVMLGICMVTSVQANEFAEQGYASLSVSQAQLDQCAKQKPATYQQIRDAIQTKQYKLALELLGEPVKRRPRQASPKETNPGEINYLYGKTLYLMAYQQVNQGLVSSPDRDKLAQAEKYLTTAAQQGFAEAMFDQAMLITAPEDNEQKLRLLQKSADKKFVPAMLKLAEHQFYAIKTFEERIEAQALIKAATELNSDAKVALASYYLHEDKQLASLAGYDKDIDEAIRLLHSAAMECSAEGAYKLFQMSLTEHKPNDLPVNRAHYWLEVSAKLGLPRAQGDLAEYYFNEKQDQEQALYWAERAANRANLKGLLILGKLYYQGEVINRDFASALRCYQQALAIDKDNRLALNQLGIMYYKGEGMEIDFRKAASFCERAADKGQAGCQYYLGLMYVNGEGVTQDIDTGISWLKKSAAQDFPIAKNWLRENW